ncbi:MAG: D-hexose-6-phosphate mutarotase [Tepidisphaeraceae bacterium]|jgi:D-hexose-6-phosphate mutarotase
MQDVGQLQEQFGVSGVVRIESGRGSLPMIVVNAEPAEAEIYLHGAHVAHFQPRGAAPVLFLSRSSWFAPDKPIRGGVPLVFPWFGARAGYPQAPAHGLARISDWRIESCDVRSDGSVRLVLNLSNDEQTHRHWPYEFVLRLIVIISAALEITLEVRNVARQLMEFEEALHTYLQVGDCRRISVEGLAGAAYIDRADGSKRKTQPAGPITIAAETDCLFLDTRCACLVHDPAMQRTIQVEKEGSDATVVWNPWIAKSKAMPDFGDDEWVQMLCVETANAADYGVKLPPGQTHRMTTRVSVL